MSSDDRKFDDKDDVAPLVQAADEFEDDAGGQGYTMGEDADFDTDAMDAEDDYADPQEERQDRGEADEFSEDTPAGNGKMKKMFAPALILVCAAGIGAYIVMNPGLIGGGSANIVPMQQEPVSPPPPVETAAPAPIDEMPPQPVALEQVQENNAVPALPDESVSNPAASVPLPSETAVAEIPPAEPAAVTDAAVPPETSKDVSEDLGLPPSAPPDVEIAGIPSAPPPDVTEAVPAATPAPDTNEVPVVPAETAMAPDVPVAAVQVVEDASAPAFPEVTSAPVEQTPVAPVEEFPQVATEPVKQEAVSAPGLEGGGVEEGIVGKGAQEVPPSQETALIPMEEKPAQATPAADNFFDSKMTIPARPAVKDTGPRKVDPVLEPGSKFVVVNKTHNAQSQESLLVSANRALKLGRYEAAIEMYDSLYERNPKDPAILLGRAVSYQKAGRADSALKVYDELLAVDHDNESALLNMLGLLREQYPEVALRRLLNLHEQYPGNAGVAAQIGLTQADMNHYDEALRYLGMAASIEPKNAQHLFNMGIVADRKGDRANAVKFYEQALETDAVYGGGRSIPREQIYDRLSVLRRG